MKDLQQINDSLDSMHHRMDRFYAFASQLMVEHRDMKQRIGFLESKLLTEADTNDEALLAARLTAVKK